MHRRPIERLLARRGSILHSVPDLTRLGLDYAPAELISSSQRRRLTQVGARYPVAFSFGCFACRLNDVERVDLMACTARADGGHRVWPRDHELERGLDRLIARWAGRASELAQVGSAVWLEFDGIGDTSAPPFAFVHLGGAAGVSLNVAWRVLAAIARALPKGALPSDWRYALVRLERALPKGAAILDVAPNPHGCRSVRIHVALRRAQVLPFLHASGWSGDERAVTDALTAWSRAPQVLGVQVEVGSDRSPDVDLEFYLETHPGTDPRWEPIIRYLEGARIAQKEKLRAVARWTAPERMRRHWPLIVVRRLQLKLRISAREGPSAKCYLGFSPRFSLA